MADIMGNLEKRLITTREKIRSRRREITSGVLEDKVKEIGKKTYEELDKDLEGLQKAVIKGKAKASGASQKLFDEIGQDISATRKKLREKRMEITGGVAEKKAKAAAHTIKEKGEIALKEIEEDIAKLSAKLKDTLNRE